MNIPGLVYIKKIETFCRYENDRYGKPLKWISISFSPLYWKYTLGSVVQIYLSHENVHPVQQCFVSVANDYKGR